MKLVKINNHIFEYDGRNYKYKTKEEEYINIDYIVEVTEVNKYSYAGPTLYEVKLINGSKVHIDKKDLDYILIR